MTRTIRAVENLSVPPHVGADDVGKICVHAAAQPWNFLWAWLVAERTVRPKAKGGQLRLLCWVWGGRTRVGSPCEKGERPPRALRPPTVCENLPETVGVGPPGVCLLSDASGPHPFT